MGCDLKSSPPIYITCIIGSLESCGLEIGTPSEVISVGGGVAHYSRFCPWVDLESTEEMSKP